MSQSYESVKKYLPYFFDVTTNYYYSNPDNKQKILEFRYVARDILNDPDVPEEHRSNVLGQIIAKGERISIDAAIEFIDQKTLELVITEEISDKLKHEIKSISKRR